VDPQALRLVAEVTLSGAAGGSRWLRILGDERRGYLVVGDLEPAGAPALDEIWFPTLDEALGAAERAGVPRSAWGVDQASASTITERARRRPL
jgi:hypothetical protein